MKILLVAGARPNFPKIAPLAAELRRHADDFEARVVHTGQHYDYQLSGIFFEELELGPPDHFLQARTDAGRAGQMADVTAKFDVVLDDERPDLVVVFGDVVSTVYCSLGARLRDIPVAHVEAGLRSGDRTMPEEIARVAVDAVADLHFTTEPSANRHLADEGVPTSCVHHVGNLMIDTLLRFRPQAQQADTLARHDLEPRGYALVTLHRQSNLADEGVLAGLVDALVRVAAHVPLLFPVHPGTRRRLQETGLASRLEGVPAIQLVDPVGYVDMLCLMDNARLALVDSGGIQEETTVLGVPCLTMRHNTERPVTISEGTNRLVGTDPDHIVDEALKSLAGDGPAGQVPQLWDGRAAQRIVEILRGGIRRRGHEEGNDT